MEEIKEIVQEQIIEAGQKNILKECSRCKKITKIYNKKDVLCKSCYNNNHLNKDKQKEYTAKWKLSHPDYFKNYYKKNE